jgi:hypothetical protein
MGSARSPHAHTQHSHDELWSSNCCHGTQCLSSSQSLLLGASWPTASAHPRLFVWSYCSGQQWPPREQQLGVCQARHARHVRPRSSPTAARPACR